MGGPWEAEWDRVGKVPRGGQGDSFLARSKDGSRRAFIKVLRKQQDPQARARFYREAAAYETLVGDGIPSLIEHNADHWKDLSVPLYMALETIPGSNLHQYIQKFGPRPADEALNLASKLAHVLQRSHVEGHVHRDIKPANIMLRNGQATASVLVDFGLSFNGTDDEQITRVGEEVGNRFLRLPEHAVAGRSAVSDLTQLAGVLLYALTGIEPRVLRNEQNLAPHLRDEQAQALSAEFEGLALLRINALFDRAFAPDIGDRFQTAEDLLASIAGVLAPETGGDFATLLEGLATRTQTPEARRIGEDREELERILWLLNQFVNGLAFEHRLAPVQSSQTITANTSPPAGETSLALTASDPSSAKYVRFRVELVSADIASILADGVPAWRGSRDAIGDAREKILSPILAKYLAG